MAAGDVVNDIQSISASGYLSVQPSAGVEWVIHNIYYEGAVEIYYFDGTNRIKIASDSANGSLLKQNFHCTNSKYIQIKNVEASSKLLGYDGVQTK